MSSVDGAWRGDSPAVDIPSEPDDAGHQRSAGGLPSGRGHSAADEAFPVAPLAEPHPEIPAPFLRHRMEGRSLILEDDDESVSGPVDRADGRTLLLEDDDAATPAHGAAGPRIGTAADKAPKSRGSRFVDSLKASYHDLKQKGLAEVAKRVFFVALAAAGLAASILTGGALPIVVASIGLVVSVLRHTEVIKATFDAFEASRSTQNWVMGGLAFVLLVTGSVSTGLQAAADVGHGISAGLGLFDSLRILYGLRSAHVIYDDQSVARLTQPTREAVEHAAEVDEAGRGILTEQSRAVEQVRRARMAPRPEPA